MTLEISKVILRNLQYNEEFSRKVLPFFKEEYFDAEDKVYFKTLSDYFLKYNALPNKEAISINLLDIRSVSDEIIKSTIEMAEEFEKTSSVPDNKDWLLEKAEKYCQNKALHLALLESVAIADGKNGQILNTAIPDILSKAVSLSFDNKLGHDYFEDAIERYEFYTKQISTIPLPLPSFNKATDGGLERKTLNLVVAQTGVGKSIWLCYVAAHYMMMGLNVVYFTMEMEEKKISKRIDANLMDTNINDFRKMPRMTWDDKIKYIRSKCKGRLEVKEYPSGQGNAALFRAFITELKQKKNFIPDVIIVDYIGITGSTTFKTADNLYVRGAAVSVEIRALGQENNAIVWTASQFNSQGMNNSDADIQHISDSRAIVHNCDFAFALIPDEDLTRNGQIMVKLLKARESDKDSMQKFIIGLDKPKMRFYELQNNGLTTKAPSANINSQSKSNQPKISPPNKGALKL